MKAISLWQPWASLWLSDAKIHETRCWPTKYRGPLLVHAAKRNPVLVDPGTCLDDILTDEFGGHWGMDLPTGAIIGVVDLVDCRPTETMADGHQDSDDFWCGDFCPGRFAWKRERYTVFKHPVPYRGRQRIFNIPDEDVNVQTAPEAPESRSSGGTPDGTRK